MALIIVPCTTVQLSTVKQNNSHASKGMVLQSKESTGSSTIQASAGYRVRPPTAL